MSSTDSIEVAAATIDQAINQALAQLGAAQDDVTIEVLSTPRTGVLGLGARQARVRVTRRAPEVARSGVTSPPPAPPLVRSQSHTMPSMPPPAKPEVPPTVTQAPVAVGEAGEQLERRAVIADEPVAMRQSVDPEALAREAVSVLTQILELMGEKAEIETIRESGVENVELNVKSDGSGLLIGRRGQTLDALEYLLNRILARQLKDAPPVSLDTESYRARRRHQLHRMALAKGEQAKREHVAVELEPMPPRDRRIIHLALKDDPLVTTRSSGDGFLRSIQIVPVEARREAPGGGGRRERQPREKERSSEGDNERAVGQQGGFKHGQKRIV